jgi:hypothetical protein
LGNKHTKKFAFYLINGDNGFREDHVSPQWNTQTQDKV